MSGEPGAATKKAKARRVTSVHSYRERGQQYKRLVEVDIPENSKEIGVARSYGDLRENAEYEMARHQQGLLMQRKSELERDLAEIQETDFSEFPTEKVGVGTHIEVTMPDGTVQEFNILGEWDRDEALHIVSSSSKISSTLQGHIAGDEIGLPGMEAGTVAKILLVGPLPSDVQQWAKG